ncbi:hypothetical protein V8G54_022134 [Vigna mungo]|uniref:Reverse transcriptase Ty1/copia-type domain-containing protein n=1 Tax=Vigna mungo TaxID=3915 RepID=A0AAQ3NHF0_VIGMU
MKALSACTPEEAWSGIKPIAYHLRVFGSVCFRHIPDERRKKLDNKSEILIFVGYHPTGAYRLYDPMKKQVVISRDVVVDETTTFEWEKAEEKSEPGCVSSWLEDKSLFNAEQTDADREINNRRSQMTRFPSTRLADHEVFPDNEVTGSGDLVHFAFLADTEALTWKQAINVKEWREAMLKELKVIKKNRTWEMVELPQHKQPIDVKWVFKIKHKLDGEVAKFKSRLVARGFLQKPEVDFTDVFAPVARLETVRLLIVVANIKAWRICQMDVKSAFLNGSLEEEVYVRQPPGFVKKGE